MKTEAYVTASLMMLLLFVTASFAEDAIWPRQRMVNGNTLIIYQPQIDNWKDYKELDYRMAFSLTPAGGKPVLGVADMHAQTDVDNEIKMVTIKNIQIKRTNFPSLDSTASTHMEKMLRSFMPGVMSITLQQLVACVPKPESVKGVILKNDPPVIFVSYKPAILLDIDGQPVRSTIPKGKLEFVVNTHWPLFFDPASSQFYLLAGEQWLSASSLQGPWASAKKLPKEMDALVKDPAWKDLKKFVPPPRPEADAVVPVVFYSTSPAEVILLNGKPEYADVPGTRLKHAINTTSWLFLYTPTNQYFYLTSGRWFSAKSLGGPWTFASPNLPEDFARIPPASIAGQVRASVPGTEESKDAALLAQIPTTVTVNPATAAASVKVTYTGEPQFVPIEGTTLYYAKNTPQSVIRVGDLYYLCYQGIWFVSANPKGPWKIANSVPAVIYTIPPSSPVYHVTYVTQVTYPDGTVQSSYTSGYTGVYVMSTSPTYVVVTCGTGYYYPPYVYVYPTYAYYPVYYYHPYTYGYRTYYHSSTGAYGVSQTVYGPNGSATRSVSYNPYTGTHARAASVSTPYGTSAAGRAYNPYTGAAGATRQGANAYESWGRSVVRDNGKATYTKHYSNDQGTVGSVRTTTGGKAVGVSNENGKSFKARTGGGDVYAGHDGNVYKKSDSGWQKYEDGSWNSVEKPSSAHATQQPAQQSQTKSSQVSAQQQDQLQGLQKEAQNRERGAQASQRFQSDQRQGGGGGGAAGWGNRGGSRGGGGFRRR